MSETAFKNIDYANKAVAVPRPDRINDIDTDQNIYTNIINAAQNNILDLSNIESFTSISYARDQVYNLLDIMAQDPVISAALDIYASDCCEPNESGQIIWASGDDERVVGMVQYLLDSMSVDKNAFGWMYSLIKYGDLYLRLYRDSEYNFTTEYDKNKRETLNEDIIVKAYAHDDKYANYMEAIKNPAEVFDLQRLGKNVGYIKTHIIPQNTNTDDTYLSKITNIYQYNVNRGDVDVYPATEFVHACLEDYSSRTEEEISIFDGQDSETETKVTYSVKRGKSILYDVFKIWRELSLLENSVLLNRITKSSIIRMISVDVGEMDKVQTRELLSRIKAMIEQKSAINLNNSIENYTNPGPIENTIYVPVHGDVGRITTEQIGGDVNVGDLVDLDYFKNKLFGSLGIPKQYLGDTDDNTGFNGGTSLSLTSSKYAKTVKRLQNALIQAVTDAINLQLLDRGLTEYINEFTIKMQAPTTQEEKDRKENLSSSISNIREIMSLLDNIENQATKLNILKSLLADEINNVDVITALQSEIDRLEAEELPEEEMGETEDFSDLGEFDFGDETTEEPTTEEEPGRQPMELPPMEGFETGEGQLLSEDQLLPTWEQEEMSYTDYTSR